MNASFVRFSRQTFIGGISTSLFYLRGVFAMPLLTRSFGVEGYGIWVQLFVGVELLAGIAGLGLNFALLRFVPTRDDPRHASADLWSALLLCGFASLAMMGIGTVSGAWVSRAFFGGEAQAPVIQTALLLIPVSGSLNLVLIYFRAARAVGVYAMLVAGETAGWLLLSSAALYLERGLEWMVIGLLALRFVILIVGVVTILWHSGWWRPRITSMAPYVRYGLPLLPLFVLNWVVNASDRYFLSYFWGPEVAGAYAVSYGIGSIVGLLYSPVFFVLLPATAAAWKVGRFEEVVEYLRFAQKYPFLLAVPVILLLTGYAHEIIGIVATSQFVATSAVIGCVATAIAIMNVGAIAQTVLNLEYLSHRILAIGVGAAAFNVAANTVAVPRYGATGAAVTTLMTYGLQAAATYAMSRSILPFPWQWQLMAKALLAATPLALILTLGLQASAQQPALVIIGCASYVGLLLVFGVFEQREWKLAKAVIGSREGSP